ncbi:hypothetical protein BHM03_00004403 [Ensete ventricosum]|nr:hypothetical protein BHM03_00004403 [Ensete ventricosum]
MLTPFPDCSLQLLACLLASIFSSPSQLRSGEHGPVGRKREDHLLGLSSSSWVAFSQCGYSSREPKPTGVCRAEELLPSGNRKPSHTFTGDTDLSDPARLWLRHPNTLSWRKPRHTHSALSWRKPWQYSHGALSWRKLWQHSHGALSWRKLRQHSHGALSWRKLRQHSHGALSGITHTQRRLLPSIFPIHADDRPPHPAILHRHLQVSAASRT